MLSFIIFILILAVLVLIHEFGHFIVAKKNGILVEEFGFGFPPKIWSIKKGETEYTLNLIPLGGFVRVYGEEYHEEDKKDIANNLKNRAFIYKKPIVKAAVIVAGVIMNLILGVTIYYGLLAGNNFKSDPLPLIGNPTFTFGDKESQVAVVNVVKGSPAEKAGIKSEDIVLRYRVDQKNEWKTISTAQDLINTIKKSDKNGVYLETKNIKNGISKDVHVTPYYDKNVKRSIIGVNLIDLAVLTYQKPVQKVFSGFMHAYNIIEYNFRTIGYLVSSSMKEKTVGPVSQAVSGPVGILVAVHDVVKSSGPKLIVNLLNVIAMLSLSLAFVNILPLPALDGGRLVFIIYEWITGKPANAQIEKYTNMAGIILLLSLAVLVTINDISKVFSYFLK